MGGILPYPGLEAVAFRIESTCSTTLSNLVAELYFPASMRRDLVTLRDHESGLLLYSGNPHFTIQSQFKISCSVDRSSGLKESIDRSISITAAFSSVSSTGIPASRLGR
jgi:hypothetical protein